jgi:hypothetical protein
MLQANARALVLLTDSCPGSASHFDMQAVNKAVSEHSDCVGMVSTQWSNVMRRATNAVRTFATIPRRYEVRLLTALKNILRCHSPTLTSTHRAPLFPLTPTSVSQFKDSHHGQLNYPRRAGGTSFEHLSTSTNHQLERVQMDQRGRHPQRATSPRS